MAQQSLPQNSFVIGGKMEKIRQFLKNETVQGAIAIIAAVVMYFTPDNVDRIIEACLMALGIQKLVLKKKDE